MPVPGSLEDLSRRKACEILKGVCQSLQSLLSLGGSGPYALEYAKRVLRPYYVNSLPGTIRCRMIDETWNDLYYGSVNSAGFIQTPLYLLTILLGPDVKKLRIRLCCYYGCSHQADLLKLLSSEGIGMESLELERTAILRLDSHLLRAALTNMANLRSLTMKNIANDSILASIGRACPNLLVLDIACSQQVTDRGLHHLLVKYRFSTKKDTSVKIAERDGPNDRQGRKTTWSRIKALLKKLDAKEDKRAAKEEYLLEISETRNPICDTLRVLNITKTRVTTNGILMVLSRVPELESLADYCPISSLTEIHDRATPADPTTFRLREAHDSDTTTKRLRSLADACPRLEKLSILNPRHPASGLRAFSSLTCLTIDALSCEISDWTESLNDYLRTNGSKLEELNLRVKKHGDCAPPEFDIEQVFMNCPNLVSLTKVGGRVVWKNSDRPTSLMKHLKIIQIGNIVSVDTILNILTHSPELASLHVKSCNQLNDRDVEFLSKSLAHQNLTCLYIGEANKLTAKALTYFLQCCNRLERIGNLDNWNLSCYDIRSVTEILTKRSVNLKCSSIHHWYFNICQSFERHLQKKSICEL
ncbi:uncharacterized protein [Venturia canescens]|uniref:uncharacterized protein n=1 Tax=Venturia canescens TaxID=32260 RepID=UPI001C9C22F9|nr:uncharacterized protein LOC122408905 [Venturia canescens]XP_043271941.1 uncharacterized protein LOC122408905 [Venturia canescens]